MSRGRPEAPFTGAAPATCLRWFLPLKVRLPGGRSSRGTGTGEVGAIQAKLRYGEQAKGSAGEFRQARTHLDESQDSFGPCPQPSSVQSL